MILKQTDLLIFPPELETERLILRSIRRKDAGDLFSFARNEEVTRFVLWSPHESIRDSRRYIRCCRRQYANGFPGIFAIEHKEDRRMIGTIGYVGFSREHRCAEIGYSLDPKYWNRGLMTEALARLIRYSFEDLGLHRLEACHDINNPASGRVMEKCGMHLEGTLKDKYNNKGVYCTVHLFAIIRNERS